MLLLAGRIGNSYELVTPAGGSYSDISTSYALGPDDKKSRDASCYAFMPFQPEECSHSA